MSNLETPVQRRGRPSNFTQEEDEIIKREYPQLGTRLAAKHGWRVQALIRRANYLGVRRAPGMASRIWTDERILLVKGLVWERGQKAAAEELGVTPAAINALCIKHGMKSGPTVRGAIVKRRHVENMEKQKDAKKTPKPRRAFSSIFDMAERMSA